MASSERDNVLEVLASELKKSEGKALWLADEQSPSLLLEEALRDRRSIYVSNRIDQVEVMQRKGVDAEFHDFDLQLLKQDFDHLFIRVPKQRSQMHHFLNLAPDILKPGGFLWIAGQKNEGVKTHIKRAEQRLGTKAEKIRSASGVGLYRLAAGVAGPILDDDSYVELRELEMAPGMVFWSKPSIYGWDKIDQGSQALSQVMQDLFSSLSGKCVLDLGCGYGYLASQAWQLGPDLLVASDNHAGAVQATAKNLPAESRVQVVAADCGGRISREFDLILCNPPFHRGFSTTTALHQKFLAAIGRLLASHGRALLVLNSFLKIDRQCREVGLTILNNWEFAETNFTVFELARENSA